MASNGGSLEDCYSNVFALTELNGLKWRCFVTPSNAPRGVPVPSDTVLRAYGKCLQDGIICTWRRKPLSMPSTPEPMPVPSFTNDISKELWLFWYSNEPPENLDNFTSQLEHLDEFGIGTAANGIPYEVRVLFFKALHTVIERNLSKTGVVRLGKWFTKPLRLPLPGRQHLISHYVMAFNLQFFVHGGNTVCMTLNAQRQPTLLRLSKRHLECNRRVQVVLGPWSLRAVLLPTSECGDAARNQMNGDRQWEEWKEFVAVEHEAEKNDDEKEEGIARMVTIEIDGIRMMYPSGLVCVTLEDDSIAQKLVEDENATPPGHPDMTPDELVASDGSRRNPLLVSNMNGAVHLQGVLQNAHLGRRLVPASTPGDTFREPFPVQADEDTKWNFVDPGRADVCSCSSCRFQPPIGFQGEKPDEPAVSCPLALPLPVLNPAFAGQKRTNPALVALRRQSRRKTQHSYHRRWAVGGGASRTASRAPSPISEAESEMSSDEDRLPKWAQLGRDAESTTTTPTRVYSTDIYCSADDAATHYYGVASPANSSDDENLQCSPFTPIKVISPCHDCHWPSADAEKISEATFNEIFQPGSCSRVPPTACQEDRAKDYDYYYNPTLREDPLYMSYHSRRHGEKRHSSYPPTIQMPSSPDQPGSQETIPATTSPPPPELDERRRAAEGGAGGVAMVSHVKRDHTEDTNQQKDEYYPRWRRSRRSRRHQNWPEVAGLNVTEMASHHKFQEDVSTKVPSLCGFHVPVSNDDWPVDHYEGDSEENRSNGEPASCLSSLLHAPAPFDAALSLGEEPMEVDGSMPMDNIILSPPASNERIDSYTHPTWPRMSGPPSVGDPSMNQIYPTPPSVIADNHQFSPVQAAAAAGSMIPTSAAAGGQSEPVSALDLISSSISQQVKQELEDESMETSQFVPVKKYPMTYVEEEPETWPLPENSKMFSLLKSVESLSKGSYSKRTYRLDGSGRFAVDEVSRISIDTKPRPLEMPPDYQKLLRQMSTARQQTKTTVASDASLAPPPPLSYRVPSVGSSALNTASPVGSLRSNTAYKVSFGPGPAMPPNMGGPQQQMMGGHMGMGYGPPGQMGMHRAGGPAMMAGRGGLPPYGTMAGANPYHGGPGQFPGGGPPTTFGGQPPQPTNGYGTVQQLNNFVNGPMPPNMYGMGGPHQQPMGGMGGPPGPMGGPTGQMGGPMNAHHINQPGGPTPMGMYGSPQMMPSSTPSSYGGMDSNMQQQQQQHPAMTTTGGYMPNQCGSMGAGGGPMTSQQMHAMRMQQQQQQQQNMQQTPGGMQMMRAQGGPQGQFGPPVPVSTTVSRESTIAPHAEGTSLVLAIILQDTILDLHYDTVFDACPICSCYTSIKARELGLYITPPDALRLSTQQQQQTIHSWSGFGNGQGHGVTCNCGFSAVRHRYLSLQSGLFPEDSKEATANDNSIAPVGTSIEGAIPISSQIWFNPSSHQDVNVLNLLRVMCLRQGTPPGKMVHQIAFFHEYAEQAFKGQDVGFSVGSNAEYIVSQIDSTELLLLGNSTVDMALVSGSRLRNKLDHKFLQFFHPWGLQLANEVREPKEAEWRGILSEVAPILEKSMRIVRCSQGPGSIVEGPLTWRSLTSKRQKAVQSEDDSYLSEPLPHVLVANDRDLIRTSPQAIRLWEQLSLGPVDQPKDVLYMTVVPDNTEIHEKSLKYMSQLSQLYERMRLGRHIAWNIGEIQNGIVRAGGRPSMGKCNRASFDFLEMVGKYIDNRVFLGRLRLFTQEMEQNIAEALIQFDGMFERQTYREALAMDARQRKAAAAALAAAVDKQAEGGATAGQQPFSGNPGSTGLLGQKGADQTSSPLIGSSEPTGGLSELLSLEPHQQQQQQPQGQQPIPMPVVPNTIFKEDPPLEVEEIPADDYGALPHVIVIYIMNPFTWGTDARSVLCARVATLALMRTFNAICSQIPQNRRPQLHLEILPMEQMGDMLGMLPDYMNDGRDHVDVYEKGENEREMNVGYLSSDSMKSTALSVYSAPRALLPDAVRAVQARCMTKFGPGSALLESLAELERGAQPAIFSVPSSPFHLAPPPFILQDPTSGKIVQIPQEEQVLYVTYCLMGSEFLCAAVTDSQGRLHDNCLININTKTPNAGSRSGGKQRSKTQILDAMTRFWVYLQGVIFADIRNCRLVIGRLGKIGHGEFRAWTHLLAKSSLRKISARPKESCTACFQSPPNSVGTPAILSACLISTEPEPYLRLFPAFFNQENYVKGKSRVLSTPEDTSCTHIMVFPVNTSIELSGGEQSMDDNDIDDWGEIAGLELPQDDEFNNIQDMLGGLEGGEGPQPSASMKPGGSTSFFPENGSSEPMQNQPLATGFSVSTAPPGDLPDWFWASCPSAKRRAPVHLKSSLHINIQCAAGDQDQGDDFIQQSKSATMDKMDNGHPLDSQRTDEVLRHVLETYNALSWLNVDVVSGERKSCLPIHIQALLRLYHSVSRLIV